METIKGQKFPRKKNIKYRNFVVYFSFCFSRTYCQKIARTKLRTECISHPKFEYKTSFIVPSNKCTHKNAVYDWKDFITLLLLDL